MPSHVTPHLDPHVQAHGLPGAEGTTTGPLGVVRSTLDHASTGLDVLSKANSINNFLGLTQTARTANQAEHLAADAKLMGNTGMADVFGTIAKDRGPLDAFVNNKAVTGFSSVAGGVLGGFQMVDGVNEWRGGNRTQGAMDLAAGGLGIASAFVPGLGEAAMVAGLAAAGNQQTKDWGWWGKNKDGTNKDSLQFVGDNTASAFHSVHDWAGGGIAGDIAGGLAGGAVGLGSGAVALGGDLVGGVYSTGAGVVHAADSVLHGAGAVAGAVGNGISNAAGAIGNGVSNVAGAIGNGVSNVENGIGNAVGSVLHW
jgi:hypothetical protein